MSQSNNFTSVLQKKSHSAQKNTLKKLIVTGSESKTSNNVESVSQDYSSDEKPQSVAKDTFKTLYFNLKKHLKYLIKLLKEDPKGGFFWWIQTTFQQDRLEQAIDELAANAENGDFTLDQIKITFSKFKIKEEEQSQFDWLSELHIKITSAYEIIQRKKELDKKAISLIVSDLRMISNMEEFFEKYKLQTVRQRVFIMYQELSELLNEIKLIEKDRTSLVKEEQLLEKARLQKDKADADRQTEKLSALKQKEERIKIMEEKRKALALKQAEKAKLVRSEREAELKRAEADQQRELLLQKHFVELQVEEKISLYSVAEVTEKLLEKISHNKLSETDLSAISNLKQKLSNY